MIIAKDRTVHSTFRGGGDGGGDREDEKCNMPQLSGLCMAMAPCRDLNGASEKQQRGLEGLNKQGLPNPIVFSCGPGGRACGARRTLDVTAANDDNSPFDARKIYSPNIAVTWRKLCRGVDRKLPQWKANFSRPSGGGARGIV